MARQPNHKNSSGDEITNVNFYAVRPEATEFGKITQNKGHYAVQCHPFWYQSKVHIRLPNLPPILLLVINTNLPPVLHRFRDIAFDRSKIAIFGYPCCINSPDGGVALGRSPESFPWMSTYGQGTKRRRNIAENFNRLSRVHERYRQTTDGRTDCITFANKKPSYR